MHVPGIESWSYASMLPLHNLYLADAIIHSSRDKKVRSQSQQWKDYAKIKKLNGRAQMTLGRWVSIHFSETPSCRGNHETMIKRGGDLFKEVYSMEVETEKVRKNWMGHCLHSSWQEIRKKTYKLIYGVSLGVNIHVQIKLITQPTPENKRAYKLVGFKPNPYHILTYRLPRWSKNRTMT